MKKRPPTSESAQHCPTCGYCWQGLPECHRCPECGLAFDASTVASERGDLATLVAIWFLIAIVAYTFGWMLPVGYRQPPSIVIYRQALGLTALCIGSAWLICMAWQRRGAMLIATSEGIMLGSDIRPGVMYAWSDLAFVDMLPMPMGWRTTLRLRNGGAVGVNARFADEVEAERFFAAVMRHMRDRPEQGGIPSAQQG